MLTIGIQPLQKREYGGREGGREAEVERGKKAEGGGRGGSKGGNRDGPERGRGNLTYAAYDCDRQFQ